MMFFVIGTVLSGLFNATTVSKRLSTFNFGVATLTLFSENTEVRGVSDYGQSNG